MERALIIGCGYVGAALAPRLRDAGVEVSGTSASGGPGLLRLDLTAPDSGPELAAEGAVVYYMVSTLARRYDAEARPHLRPLERCLAALERQAPAGLVYLSSTSVYGDQGGAWIDEQTPTAPQTPWGRMRVELEQRFWDFGAARGLPACVVRLPEIYGPGRGLFVENQWIVTWGPGRLGHKSWQLKPGKKTGPSLHCSSLTNLLLGYLLSYNEK